MKVIDYAEGNTKLILERVNKHDANTLQRDVNFSLYKNLQQCCRDLVNVIIDDRIFSNVEWNLMHDYYKQNNFTEEDWEYISACGYDADQFNEFEEY